MKSVSIPIHHIDCSAFEIPTDAPESDGTLSWSSTTLVVAQIHSPPLTGLGYTYASAGALDVIDRTLTPELLNASALDIPALWSKMVRAVRNIGWRGIAANAIAAVDVALWDLKAKAFGVSLAELFGRGRDAVPIYGSGGFTSYPEGRLKAQLTGWVEALGCGSVKMKIGGAREAETARMKAAASAVAPAELYVDANGAYTRAEARSIAKAAAELGVTWFEEPVSSDDLSGLNALRGEVPAGMRIAAGEYGYEPLYFRRMLEAQAVDVLQIDATRCCGYSGFLAACHLADAFGVPVSTHTAPALHLPVALSAPRVSSMEWFHDHVRIERMLFDGVCQPRDGRISADASVPGHGLELRSADADPFKL